MIDLHIHTVYSDGTDDVITLLSKAEKLKLEAISITDHDTVNAYSEFKNIDVSKYFSGIIIPGAELKTTFNKIPIEILGYGIDTEKMKLSPCTDLKRRLDIQNKYLQNFIRVGNELGIKCNQDLNIEDEKGFAAITYYREIIKYPENFEIIPEILNDKLERFYRLTSSNPKSPFYIDESDDFLDINLVIDEIHKYGGKAFLAHLFETKIDNHLEFLDDIINNTNIDGVECFYPTFAETQTNSLLEIIKKHNLYASGGTDYHGTTKKDLNLGTGYGTFNVPIEIIKEWYNEYKN
jgi:Predicted metal-dependent phosphoesterases (PHP family)